MHVWEKKQKKKIEEGVRPINTLSKGVAVTVAGVSKGWIGCRSFRSPERMMSIKDRLKP